MAMSAQLGSLLLVGFAACAHGFTPGHPDSNAPAPKHFSEEDARDFAVLASVAYCNDTTHVTDWTCETCALSESPLVPGRVKVVQAGFYNAQQVIVGKLKKQPGCIFAIRGSETTHMYTWARDFEFLFVKPENYTDCPNCTVHYGFYHTWENIRAKTEQALRDVGCSPESNGDNLIYVTGHSLGASLSYLAMFTLQNHGFKVALSHNFESSRVGNQAFAEAFQANFARNIDVFRITHNQDPVPHLPPHWLGYVHVGTEVFYNAKGDHVVCPHEQDPSCAWRFGLESLISWPHTWADQHCNLPSSILSHSICAPKCSRPQGVKSPREIMV